MVVLRIHINSHVMAWEPKVIGHQVSFHYWVPGHPGVHLKQERPENNSTTGLFTEAIDKALLQRHTFVSSRVREKLLKPNLKIIKVIKAKTITSNNPRIPCFQRFSFVVR